MKQIDPFHAILPGGSTHSSPLITPYIPDKPGFSGLSLIIFPGGGYRHRAEHEGIGYASFFEAEGIACFVVDYRVAPDGVKHPAMIEDAYAAIATVRQRCEEFGLDPNKVGVIGSSAGGHLAAHTTIAWRDYTSPVSLRPAFAILCYPVIYMNGEFCHPGSVENLLGPNPTDEDIENVSVVERVDNETPPCFIWHTLGDAAVPVENSLGFATALRVNDVPFEMHIYQRGGHGLGRKTALCWPDDCLRWLRETADGRH